MSERLDQDWYTPKDAPDPNDRRTPAPLPRLWPWVVMGLLCAYAIAAYHEAIWMRVTQP